MYVLQLSSGSVYTANQSKALAGAAAMSGEAAQFQALVGQLRTLLML